jgi:hypothetical protein
MPVLKQELQDMYINDRPSVFKPHHSTLYTEQNTLEEGVERQSVILEDGDLLVRGPRTNEILKHAVLPLKDERIIKRNGADVRSRITVGLRDIKTQLSQTQVMVKVISRSSSSLAHRCSLFRFGVQHLRDTAAT